MAARRPNPGPDAPRSTPPRLAFGDVELDAASGELHRAGGTVHLEPQPAKVLLYLAERAGQVVRRKELHRHLWGEGKHVEADQGLNYCIKELRNALGDSAREPRYIETLRRRGYRFLVPVVPAGAATETERDRPGAFSGDRGGALLRGWAGLRGSGAPEAAALLVFLLAALGLGAAGPAGSPAGGRTGEGGSGEETLRVAVLPFEACGRGDDTLTRGLPAAVISRLAHLEPRGVEVVAATSSFAYHGRGRTAREIGRALRVSYVVEGTFHHAEGEPRLDVRLVDTAEDAVVWTGSYRADPGRVDTLADRLTEAVAGAVRPETVPPRLAASR